MTEKTSDVTGLPPVTVQILEGVAKKSDLTRSQVDLLTDHARLEEQWQAWTVGVSRHPGAGDTLSRLEQKRVELAERIGADPKLLAARNSFDQALSEAGLENEP